MNVELALEKGYDKFRKLISVDDMFTRGCKGSTKYQVPNLPTEHLPKWWLQSNNSMTRSTKS